MANRIGRHIRSQFVGYIALFVALGGTGAYAAGQIGANDIKTNAIRGRHIKNERVTGADVKNGTLTRDDTDASIPSTFGNSLERPAIWDGTIYTGQPADYEIGFGGSLILRTTNTQHEFQVCHGLTGQAANFVVYTGGGAADTSENRAQVSVPAATSGRSCSSSFNTGGAGSDFRVVGGRFTVFGSPDQSTPEAYRVFALY